MSRETLQALLDLLMVNSLAILLLMCLTVVGQKQLSKGWEEGVPTISPRPLAYAEVLCGILGVANALVAVGAVGTIPLAAVLVVGLSIFWFVFYHQIGKSVESAKQASEERHRLKRGWPP